VEIFKKFNYENLKIQLHKKERHKNVKKLICSRLNGTNSTHLFEKLNKEDDEFE
jgi:hypothetical protein